MSDRLKIGLVKYSLATLVAAALTVVYCASRDVFSQELMEQYRILCDGFTVPGLLLIMLGCLAWISGTGFFDGISYACSVAFKALLPGGRLTIQKYYDYVQERKEKRLHGYGFLFVVGGAFMAVSFVFMALFYSLYGK